MRGSPLLRSILILLALSLSAIVFARITNVSLRQQTRPPESQQPVSTASAPAKTCPYRLVLSAEAAEVSISTPGGPETSALSGNLDISPDNPAVLVSVRWKNPAEANEHRFAKLTLEPAGKPTFTHVFDAPGDIDDIVELP